MTAGTSDVAHGDADVGDVRLHYVHAGNAGEPVVLLHGWPQTWFSWRDVIPLLATEHHVVAPDLRGLGDSSRPASGYDKRTIAADVYRLMHDVLGHERWHVVGHDWGGVVAYAMAAAHPESVIRLAIVDVTIPGDGQRDISQGGRRWHHGFHCAPGLAEQLVSGREDLYLGWFYRNYGHRPDVIDAEAVTEYLRTYRDPEALRAGFEYYRALPTDIADNEGGRVAKLTMPVLAVGGSEGWGRGSEVAASLRQMADDVEEVVVAPAGHWVPEEQPTLLARHLLWFLASSTSPAPARPGSE